jgi:hypothetical protein
MNSTDATDKRFALVAQVKALSMELDKANADVALRRRLEGAEGTAVNVEKELTTVQEKLAELLVSEVKKNRAAEFANFKAVRVDTRHGEHSSVLHNSYSVTITKLSYNMHTRQNDWEDERYSSFATTPIDVMRYLVLIKPEAIPVEIMNLAPGDPQEAMRQYVIAKKRGYLNS